jgi:hypothetical protein
LPPERISRQGFDSERLVGLIQMGVTSFSVEPCQPPEFLADILADLDLLASFSASLGDRERPKNQ